LRAEGRTRKVADGFRGTKKYQVCSLQTDGIDTAEVVRWRKVRAIPARERNALPKLWQQRVKLRQSFLVGHVPPVLSGLVADPTAGELMANVAHMSTPEQPLRASIRHFRGFASCRKQTHSLVLCPISADLADKRGHEPLQRVPIES